MNTTMLLSITDISPGDLISITPREGYINVYKNCSGAYNPVKRINCHDTIQVLIISVGFTRLDDPALPDTVVLLLINMLSLGIFGWIDLDIEGLDSNVIEFKRM